MEEPGVWTLRVAWLLMPLVAGPCYASALDPTDSLFRSVTSTLLWVAWATVLVATLVPRTVTLTALRTVIPASVPASIWAATAVPNGVAAWQPVLAVGWSVMAAAASLSPFVGDVFVNGSAYGPERRLTLRLPGSLLVLAPITWAVVVVGATAGPLLLAAGVWLLGGLALAVGLPIAFLGSRSLHGLARRWVVMVPAGLVLHDPFGLPDALLFPRRMISGLGPAPASSDALDLTQRAPGLALLIELTEPLPIGQRSGRTEVESIVAQRLIFTPTRPGAVLAEAAQRRIAVRLPTSA